MTITEKKVKVFQQLLDKFENEDMRLYCEDMIKTIPNYIFSIASSSTGKYHNVTQCKPHGQIYHVWLYGIIMNYILDLEYIRKRVLITRFSKIRDCIRCAVIFHDALKRGIWETHTVHEHPLLAASWIKAQRPWHDISWFHKRFISRLVSIHSGQWRTSAYSDIKLPRISNKIEFLFHLGDYLASRKDIDLVFDCVDPEAYDTLQTFKNEELKGE